MSRGTASFVAVCAIIGGHLLEQVSGIMNMQMLMPSTNVSANKAKWPFLVPLVRESMPVVMRNMTVSHKTSYSGAIFLGRPAQEFRVVFDTGSGHIVVPSADCTDATCAQHRQYSIRSSKTSTAINGNGAPVAEDELCDQVTIGYGTGKVKGEFVREQVCPGSAQSQESAPCFETSVIMAVEMSDQPFRSFNFDGIFGLGLDGLAMTPEFSFLHRLAAAEAGASHQFGVFLTDEEGQSEIALGGHNDRRLLTPLKWTPVALQQMGYWQVSIEAVKVDGKILPACQDGTCRGIVDTGTSHLGVPGPELRDFVQRLSVDVFNPLADCRQAAGPDLEYVLAANVTLKLTSGDYMRPLSLQAGTNVGMSNGTPVLTGVRSNATGAAGATAPDVVTAGAAGEIEELRSCVPKLTPVNLRAPLGPKLFILGEPILQKYYSVYDWGRKQVGFGLSASSSNRKIMQQARFSEDQSSLIQVVLKLRAMRRFRGVPDQSSLMQVVLKLSNRVGSLRHPKRRGVL